MSRSTLVTTAGVGGQPGGVPLLDGNSGLLVPSYAEVTQSSAPAAPAAGKTRLYVDSNGLLQLLPASGSSRRIAAHWGSGTAFPAGAAAGDTFLRTDQGTNGSLWHYTGNATLGAAGWLPEGRITCTSTSRPTLLHAGLDILETDTLLGWTYDGSTWFPDNPGRINGKMWVTGAQTLTISTYNVITFGASRLNAGLTFDAPNQAIKLPYDGYYRITHHDYVYGTAPAEAMFLVTRIRSGVASADGCSSMVDLVTRDKQVSVTDVLPLKAGDSLQMRAYSYNTGLAVAANGESNGVTLYAEYVSPLYGAGVF